MISKDDFNKKVNKDEKVKKSFFKSFFIKLFIKVLIVILLILCSMIYIKNSEENKNKFEKVVYNNSLSFAKIYGIYKKYLGDVIPFKNMYKDNTKLVNDNKLSYYNIAKENDGYVLEVDYEYALNAIKKGIVIKIEKDDVYLNKVTIQDENGINVTYGYLNNVSVKLYDYVEEGKIIGNCNNKLYLLIESNGKYLSYEEYL